MKGNRKNWEKLHRGEKFFDAEKVEINTKEKGDNFFESQCYPFRRPFIKKNQRGEEGLITQLQHEKKLGGRRNISAREGSLETEREVLNYSILNVYNYFKCVCFYLFSPTIIHL